MQRIGYLTSEGFIVPAKILKERLGKLYDSFFNKLTIKQEQYQGVVKVTKLYAPYMHNGTLCALLPRALIPRMVPKILDRVENQLPPLNPARFDMCVALYDNQHIVINYLLEHIFTADRIAAGSATAILNLQAGGGKTYVAAGMIAALGLRTLYIVPRVQLADQCIADLRGCFPAQADLIGKFNPISTDTQLVTVVVINTALDRPKEFFTGYSFVILDEVHMYCSEKRRAIFKKCTAPAVLGMSATTEDRTDGLDVVAHKELAVDGIIRADKLPNFAVDNVQFDCTVRLIRYKGPEEFTKKIPHPATGDTFAILMTDMFMQDPYRMKLILKEINALYNWRGESGQSHNIYVFCEKREHVKAIYSALLAAGQAGIDAPEITPEELAQFMAGVNNTEEIKQNARILITTYAYSGTGVSIVKMSAIVLATPRRAQMRQIVGRIFRRGGDASIRRVIVDIVDQKTTLRRQLEDRQPAYHERGASIEVVDIDYTKV